MSDTIKYINGYKSPAFRIFDINYNFIEKISLRLCDKDGLIEEAVYARRTKSLFNYKRKIRQLGFYRRFTLSYASGSDATNSKKIEKIHNYSMADELYIIEIIPRSDYEYRHYKVAFMNESLKLGIKRGGANARGNKGLVLIFETLELEKDLQWINPNEVQYFGYTMPTASGVLQTS